ncbi:MAG: hypothetical protein IJT46_00085 [Bacteroidaceae bacterium]|nr:hypothetical protein [Bacteroidaceae bacterium]
MFNCPPNSLREALRGVRESLLRVFAVSATGERNASYTPKGMPPVSRSRYCAGHQERPPSATAGGTGRIGDTKLLHGCPRLSVSVGVWQNYFIEKAQKGKAQKGKAQEVKAQEVKAQEESTEWMSTQRTFLSVFNITPRRGRKPIAQGNALGISMRLGSP